MAIQCAKRFWLDVCFGLGLISLESQVANHLDRAVSNLGRHPLKVLVQVNTSGEVCEYITIKISSCKLISYSSFVHLLLLIVPEIDAAKSGIEPCSVVELARHVKLHCPNLVFCGLMTIGMPDYTSTPENFRV